MHYGLIMFFLGMFTHFPQEATSPSNLTKEAKENYLSFEDSDTKYRNALKIGEQARKLGYKEAELWAITSECVYFKKRDDFKNMIFTARRLFKKADSYDNIIFKASAKRYLFEAYCFNNLLDKAYAELQQGLEIVNRANPKDSLGIIIKLDLIASASNYYTALGDSKKQLEYLRMFGKECEKIGDEDFKQNLLYVNYSNMAGFYLDKHIDSAQYYGELTLSKDKGYRRDDVNFFILSILGQVAIKKKDYETAISYFKEAEQIGGYHNHNNKMIFYENIIKAYQNLGDKENVQKYRAEMDSLELTVYENQNKSLHTLLNEKTNNNGKYIIGAGAIFALLILLVLVIRKNRILSKQERISYAYLKENSENHAGEHYSRLLSMLKSNDPAFMAYFDEIFPEFSKKLLAINPKIIQSEIEFCALLKLKASSKDIAKYRYIEHKTVQNKKYLIRKKLNIPTEIDIYQWFDSV